MSGPGEHQLDGTGERRFQTLSKPDPELLALLEKAKGENVSRRARIDAVFGKTLADDIVRELADLVWDEISDRVDTLIDARIPPVR